MKKAEFIDILSQKHEMPRKAMESVFDSTWETVIETLKKGDEVVFQYGKFVLKKRPAREARNPITGATVQVPAKIVPQFKPNKKFKDEVSEVSAPKTKKK